LKNTRKNKRQKVKHWVCPNEAELQCTASSTVICKAENNVKRCGKLQDMKDTQDKDGQRWRSQPTEVHSKVMCKTIQWVLHCKPVGLAQN